MKKCEKTGRSSPLVDEIEDVEEDAEEQGYEKEEEHGGRLRGTRARSYLVARFNRQGHGLEGNEHSALRMP